MFSLDTVGKKIQLPVLILIVVVLSVQGVAMALKSQQAQKDVLTSKGRSMAHLMAKIGEHPIANFEFATLDEHVADVTKGDQDVAYAAFYNEKGEPITKVNAGLLKDNSLLHFEQKILNDEAKKEIGAFRIGYRQTTLNEQFRSNVITVIVGMVVIAVLLAFGIAVVVRKLVARPLRELEVVITAVSKGQLNKKANFRSNDEIGHITDALNVMVGNLRDLVSQIRQAAGNINSSTDELKQSTTQILSGSKEQMGAALSASASIEEITTSIDHVAESVHETVAISNQAAAGSEGGQTVARDAADEMAKILDTIMLSSEVIGSLGQRTGKISNIVEEIRAISDQTNLLALNAAIEAARAGEQGRGFAVVADEVRKLAERAGHATTEITAMIDAIMNETNRAIGNIESGKVQIQQGVALANNVSETLSQINAGAMGTLSSVNAIADATKEQSSATHEINRNVLRIAEMAEKNNAMVENASRTSEQLQMQARLLEAGVEQFKL